MGTERKPAFITERDCGALIYTLICLSMCVQMNMCVCFVRVVLPQHHESVGCRLSADLATLKHLALIPLTEAPKASLAARASAEETKQFVRYVVLTNKVIKTSLRQHPPTIKLEKLLIRAKLFTYFILHTHSEIHLHYFPQVSFSALCRREKHNKINAAFQLEKMVA